jgi:Sugar phosphate permease
MEPLPGRNTEGLAPILGWSNDSPSLSPALTPKTPAGADEAPTSPQNKSVTSSGIGPDSPTRTVSFSSNDFSPTLSSIGCEPPALCPSTPLAEHRQILRQQNNRSATPESVQNGDVLSVEKPPLRTVITENPMFDAAVIKFQDVPDDKNPDDDVDSICSSSSESGDDEEADRRNKIPDGGWGWVVVIASLIISMIADGISFSFGLLYIKFIDHFGETKSKTAWIGSLFMAVPLLSGPIGSALVDRYGCRTMTIIGGIVSGIGFTMSAFVNTIELMYTTFGVIAGLGLGLCYVTAVVSIAYWFDKKRALATGLGACGTGIGTFVYAPMTQYFIEEYGWRGTVLLLAGTFFNMCVCGAVMRDPEWWIQEQNKSASLGTGNKSVKGTSSCGSISGRSGIDGDFPGVEEIRQMLKSGQAPEYLLTTLADNTTVSSQGYASADVEHVTSSRSVVNLPTFIRQKEKVGLLLRHKTCTCAKQATV